MKFLFVAPRFHPNQHAWVKALINNGHTVRFWAWWEGVAPENHSIVVPEKITPSLFSKGTQRVFENLYSSREKQLKLSSKFGFPAIFHFYKKFKKYNPDVVVARHPHTNLFSFISMVVARLLKRQIIIYNQTSLHKKMKSLNKALVNFLIRVFDAKWITPVLGDREKYSKKFHPKAFYVPFAVDMNNIPKREGRNVAGKINIISVGKLDQTRKNNLLLLQALKKLENNVDFHLTIVGALRSPTEPIYKKTKKYINNNDLQDRVIIKENICHNDTIKEYAKNDLFILPSSDEQAAYSPLEAMAVGMPVICSDTNGTRWCIEEGENGYIFKSNDLNDLIDKIKLVTKSREQIEKMGEHSLFLAKKNHSLESFYNSIMEIIYK